MSDKRTDDQLRAELIKISKARGADETRHKKAAHEIQAELDSRDAAERFRKATEGMTDEQRIAALESLKVGA